MGGSFQYQWWTVEILFDCGKMTAEYKGKSKDGVIKQIEKEIAFTNSEKNLSASWLERKNQIKKVYWDTMKLDRVGYQREF